MFINCLRKLAAPCLLSFPAPALLSAAQTAMVLYQHHSPSLRVRTGQVSPLMSTGWTESHDLSGHATHLLYGYPPTVSNCVQPGLSPKNAAHPETSTDGDRCCFLRLPPHGSRACTRTCLYSVRQNISGASGSIAGLRSVAFWAQRAGAPSLHVVCSRTQAAAAAGLR